MVGRARRVQVSRRADHAIEWLVEHRVAAEEGTVRRHIRRRPVREADLLRPPLRPDQLAQDPEHHRHTQLHRLPRCRARPRQQVFADDHGLPGLFDAHDQRGADQLQVAAQGVERLPRRRLLLQHQADRPQVGKRAARRQPQRKILHAGGAGGKFQQFAQCLAGNQRLRVPEQPRGQPGLAQQGPGIVPERLRQLDEATQAGAADKSSDVLHGGGPACAGDSAGVFV
ncbi:hypothetical protein D3C72_1591430 [compost metagenome]